MNSSYQKLMDQFYEINTISGIESVMGWDTETTMPFAGLQFRSRLYKYTAQLKQSKWKSKLMSDLITETDKNERLDEFEQRNFELLKRDYISRTQVPDEIVTELTVQARKTNEVWKRAKKDNDFSRVVPDLTTLFDLNLRKAEKLAELRGFDDPYEALIAERDPGFTVDKISSLFSSTRSFLVPLSNKHKEKIADLDTSILDIRLSRLVKEKLAKEVAGIFTYDAGSENNATVGEVEHPLTFRLGPKDVRITVKFEHWEKVIFSSAHEVGHAIDGLNLNPDWNDLPVNTYRFPSLGECNSRYTENKIARSKTFWEYFHPKFVEISGDKFINYELDELYRVLNRINPSISRMKADEVTYGLHIIIRFEIERDLFNDRVSIKELPQIWNQKYLEYIGEEPKTDTEGVMQDLHWFNVYWAYFQGYGLGDIIGSQFHHYMQKSNPNWETELQTGNYNPVLNYFRENIYSEGVLYDPLDLVKEVTGEPLQVDYFKKYLENKYNNLF